MTLQATLQVDAMPWLWLFGTFSGWLLRIQLKILGILAFSIAKLGGRTIASIGGSGRLTKKQRAEKEEIRRMAGCREVVFEYAEALGFIARECISRDELEKLIVGGIEPGDSR